MKKLFGSTVLAAGFLAVALTAQGTHASAITYTEAYFSKLEYKDATHDEERLISSKSSVTIQAVENSKQLRSTSLVLFPTKQTIITRDRDGQAEVGLRTTSDGQAYGFVSQLNKYSNSTYRQIQKGKSQAFYTPNGVKVVAGYTANNNLFFKWKGNKVLVKSKGYSVVYNDQARKENKIRTYDRSKTKTTGTKAEKLLHEARRLSGGRYVYNGQSLFYGLDCATYTQKIYLNALGVDIGSTTKAQAARALKTRTVKNAKPGDILYDGKGHVGIYMGDGKAYDMLVGGAKLRPLSHWKWTVALAY